MVSRRRVLTALAGVSALSGCLGTGDRDGTSAGTAPATTSATPPPERPDWLESDGAVGSAALLEAHDEAVGERGIRLRDSRDRVDSDEPIGTGLTAGELELETRDPEERLWLSVAAHGDEKRGYRLGFAEASVGADEQRVRYMDEGLLDSWVDLNREYRRAELAGEYPGGDATLEYDEPTVYGGVPAHRLANGDVTVVVGDDGGIRRVAGTIEDSRADAVVEFERTAEFGIDVREPPEWVSRAPWLTVEAAEADLFAVEHRGGATVAAGTEFRIRSHLDSGQLEEWRRALDTAFEPGETRYLAFQRPDEALEPVLSENRPETFVEPNTGPTIDVETDFHHVTIAERTR